MLYVVHNILRMKTYVSIINTIGIVVLCICWICIGVFSCGAERRKQREMKTSETIITPADTTQLCIDIGNADRIQLIFRDIQTPPVWVDEEHWNQLENDLLTARYDTTLNDKGIMIKMVEPDYTLVIHYKEKEPEENAWVTLWKESGRTKFRDHWFLLDENKKEDIYQLLEQYRKSE